MSAPGPDGVIRGVLFDLGSTLIRFEADWTEVAGEARRALADHLVRAGLALDGEAFVEAFQREMEAYYAERETEFIEFTTAFVLRQVLAAHGHPAPSDDQVARAVETLYSVSEAHWVPMPGVYPMLDQLQREGYRLGILSNAGDESNVQRLIDQARLRAYFDPIVISAAVGLRKPNPALFKVVLEGWGLRPEQAVMIGDTLGADILGAQYAGMHNIWLTADADTSANRAHADTIRPQAVADRLDELPDLIRRLPSIAAETARDA
jgi:putative hydrolase of the HAD superfamily